MDSIGMRPFTAPATERLPQMSQEEQEEEIGGALERFIVQELENEPFDLELNAASFSYMTKEELHELLDKILETVSPEKMESIYVAENKTEQILEFLQILRFRPAMEMESCDLKRLQTAIDEADVNFLVSLMAWLLANMATLKTRAYLSKFLTKLEIPGDLIWDEDVLAVYDLYEAEIEKFKKAHKRREGFLKQKSLAELQRDATMIQQDHDCIRRKIEMAKGKVFGSENFDETIELLRQLRFEKEKQTNLIDQEKGERRRENEMAERVNYLKETLRELRKSNDSLTPRTLVEREEQEIVIGREIVGIKLPKSIGLMRRRIKGIRSVLDNPPRHINDLEDTKQKSFVLNAECKRLENVVESMNSREASKEVVIAKKKSGMVQSRLKKLRDHLESMKETFEATKAKLTQKNKESLAKRQQEADDHNYIKNLRSKAKIYKEKKAELTTLRIQLAELQKTHLNVDKDLGKSKNAIVGKEDWNQFINSNLIELAGERAAKDNRGLKKEYSNLKHQFDKQYIAKRAYEDQKQEMLDEFSGNVITLNKEMEDRKYRLVPLLQMVQESRKQKQIVENDHSQLKLQFEEAEIGNELETLECDVEKIQETVYENELELYKVQMNSKFKSLELERAKEENNCSRGRQRSFKERLLGKIVEQERVHRDLTQEEGDLGFNEQRVQDQQQMFCDLVQLLQFKKATLSMEFSAEKEELLSSDDAEEEQD